MIEFYTYVLIGDDEILELCGSKPLWQKQTNKPILKKILTLQKKMQIFWQHL